MSCLRNDLLEARNRGEGGGLRRVCSVEERQGVSPFEVGEALSQ